ncbi:hypothetical protein [Variovorax brevis]|uniref:hypothetical protein n=1 Tax=Variovorax brevis TaxID=3053503 RepID=UPI002576BF4B|nr:hypothetical protein [Variovorax sp. J22R133]
MPDDISTLWVKTAFDWQRAALGLALQTQQGQVQALCAWQDAAGEIYRDMWDRWICRFGGGVPID